MRKENLEKITANIKDEASKERAGEEPLNPGQFKTIRKKPQINPLPIDKKIDELADKILNKPEKNKST